MCTSRALITPGLLPEESFRDYKSQTPTPGYNALIITLLGLHARQSLGQAICCLVDYQTTLEIRFNET